ncbi:MAG: SDR family NAD(P)-dependent oxidoreductase [Thermodesulfobacteriota bacterium]
MEPASERLVNAVVTGGTRGLGLGLAQSLVRRGASVAVTYRHDAAAAEKARQDLESHLQPGRSVLILQGDAGDPRVVERHCRGIREALGPVTVLVNNAGIMPRQEFEAISDARWDETIRVNLNAAFYWSSRVLPDMKEAGWGRIVNISSIAARGGGVVGPHYAASKAGLLGLTRYSARELGPWGITVNAIAPAFIQDAGIFTNLSAEQKEDLRAKIVVPRLGLVRDVVRAFEYLLDTPFVTGVCLDVNGGAFMI